jgi:probable HAF family extracellular repeat protein
MSPARSAIVCLISGIASIAIAGGARAQDYSVVEIPPATGYLEPPLGTAINATGEVTGTFYVTSNLEPHVFMYGGGVTTDLGSGDPALYCSSSISGAGGTGINGTGMIAAILCSTTETPIPAVYENGTFTTIGIGSKAIGGVTAAISTHGVIAGTIEFPITTGCPGNTYHAFRYTASTNTFQDLQGALAHIGCSSTALAINDTGQIAGYVFDASSTSHAFLFSKGTAIDIGFLPLCQSSPTPGYYAQANGINANGAVTGYSAGGCHGPEAFVYANGMMEDIGSLGGAAGTWGTAINSSGQVTGQGYTAGDVAQHAFVYNNGSLLDLNGQISSGDATTYTLVDGLAINDVGQIVAQGYVNADPSTTVTFLLTPISPAKLALAMSSSSTDGNGNYVVNVVIQNTGGTPAVGASLTAANLIVKGVLTKTSAKLPAALGSLAPGASVSLELTFPDTAGSPGTTASLRWTTKDTVGLTHGAVKLMLP